MKKMDLKTVRHIDQLQTEIYKANVMVGWWDNCLAHEKVPEKLCLIHSEISEAMEGHRKGLSDDHLPDRPMIEVELADAVIRILDLSGALNLDLAGAIKAKLEYNAQRQDHKIEERQKDGGKKY